ncbi:FMN-dependent NADPH-azoreductase [Bhargavaea cecembensis DSE10]|uniref:FMN-dependent NADPH-azoreductase n=1 Tax=Bhargavaea cecembensis DSE10 TaxID=1235279 RepID=M7P790_9BACL|nr:NAD(P)H-dependent oxidoreductase [Bhargavaea cecembensis]EMR06389.1 FMN-dependent NADPH-azoreductase [Bhargavaea cecembensis DSE10]
MKVLTLVGSLRKESFNRRLAETMQERYQDKFEMEIADIGALPHFDQDEELDPPAVVKEFKQKVLDADAIIIVTPEYNWSVPGVLKNALDWTSRGERVMVGKPVFPLGASMGMAGTLRAQIHLRQILVAPGVSAKVLPPGGNEVLVNFAQQKFEGESGSLTDGSTLEFLDQKVDAFIEFVKEG